MDKTFTVEEARNLLPKIREMLESANQELDKIAGDIESTEIEWSKTETKLSRYKDDTTDSHEKNFASISALRKDHLAVSQKMAQLREEFSECAYRWIEKIMDTGVILRDLRSGLLDFPARQGKTDYYLCWHLDDDGLDYWHLPTDGIIGRRPLAVLQEYF